MRTQKKRTGQSDKIWMSNWVVPLSKKYKGVEELANAIDISTSAT